MNSERRAASPKRRARTGKISIEDRDQIVLAHLSLVKAIAFRVRQSLPVHVERCDLEHAGILGLFDAATKYNRDAGVEFHSYAKHRIKGAILDSLRQSDWASRDLRRRHNQVEEATRDLSEKLDRLPSDAEIAERMGVALERWRQMMIELRTVGLVSASGGTGEEGSLTPEFPAAESSRPDAMLAQTEMRGVLVEAMRELPERYRMVVSLYYSKEKTMKEIGGILGINESRVSQIHKTALQKLAAALRKAGIDSPEDF